MTGAGSKIPSVRLVDGAGLGACVLVLGLAYLLGLAPRLHERASAARRRADLDSTVRELAALTEQRRGRNAVAERLGAELESGALRLSGVHDANRRIGAIVSRAKECGLRIAEIVPGVAAPRAALAVVPIKVRGTGGYAAVTELISTIHAEFPDTAVSSLTLSGSAAGGPPPEFSVEFSWYTDPNATPRAAAAPTGD